MPRIHKKTFFQTDLDILWNIITDNHNYSWRSDIKEIKIINDRKFVEVCNDGIETEFVIITKDKNKKYEIDFENTNIKGHWVGLFHLTTQGVELDMVEDVEAKKTYIKPFIQSSLKKKREHYLEDIRRAVVSQMKEK